MTTTSLLHTALQNLHVSQQMRDQSCTPQPLSMPTSPRMSDKELSSNNSSEAEDEDELVNVGKGTAPGTPVPGQKGLTLGQRLPSSLGAKTKDPLRTLPTHLAVRVFLQLDIRSLGRCDRNRALTLPTLPGIAGVGGKVRKLDPDTEFFDPYDKTPRLSSLPTPPMPTSATPQWTKMESKKAWKTIFRLTLKRSDPNAPDEVDHLRVDIDSLQSSGASTPSGRHAYAGLGSGGAGKWVAGDGSGPASSTERKLAAREGYKAMGGRKARSKRRMAGELGTRDKGGAVDDGRFDAPW